MFSCSTAGNVNKFASEPDALACLSVSRLSVADGSDAVAIFICHAVVVVWDAD